MIFIGAIILLIGIVNSLLSFFNHHEKGFNNTRLKFVVYTIGAIVLGLSIIIRQLLRH